MFNSKTYINRRKKLGKKMKQGIILFLGNSEVPYNYSANPYKFRQNSNFSYFFGLDIPNLAGVIDVDNNKCYIFGDDAGIDDIIWTGPQKTIKESALKSGVKHSGSLKDLKEFFEKATQKKRKIHFISPYRAKTKIFLAEILNIKVEKLLDKTSTELIKAIVDIRSYKELCEIKEMEKVQSAAYNAFKKAVREIKPGKYEYEIAGVFEGTFTAHNCRSAFPIICSVNGQTLHNPYHNNVLKKGQMLLIDAGAENPMYYTADITRTYPVSGKFSAKQKEIYEIVLKANKESIKMCKPGIAYRDVHMNAHRIIAEGLKTLGLIKGDAKKVAEKGAVALFMPHGLGHMLGLDAHDMEGMGEDFVGYDKETKRSKIFGLASLRLAKKLEENFVLTVEPGIYFIPELINKWKKEGKFKEYLNYGKIEKYKNFGGIRIEDNIVITKTGSRVLGKQIPKEVKQIEK